MIPFSRYDDPLDRADSAAPGMTVLAEVEATWQARDKLEWRRAVEAGTFPGDYIEWCLQEVC